MTLDFSRISQRDAYAWMTACIQPRPIAWVSTLSAAGVANLAPFSFFQGVTSNPPTLLVVPVNDRHGQPKDTVRNLAEVPEFVVNVVPFALAEQMNATAAPLPRDQSEFKAFGIAARASERIRPPRVAATPVAFECAVHSIVRVGEGPAAANIVIGRILLVHADPAVLGDDGFPDAAKLDLVARLNGDWYARQGERFTIRRPPAA